MVATCTVCEVFHVRSKSFTTERKRLSLDPADFTPCLVFKHIKEDFPEGSSTNHILWSSTNHTSSTVNGVLGSTPSLNQYVTEGFVVLGCVRSSHYFLKVFTFSTCHLGRGLNVMTTQAWSTSRLKFTPTNTTYTQCATKFTPSNTSYTQCATKF